jgi:hypothetical protein
MNDWGGGGGVDRSSRRLPLSRFLVKKKGELILRHNV